jgi:hypothetical protein
VDQGQGGRETLPSYAELERAIASVPGVIEASVSRSETTGRSRLRIRLAPGEDAESVSWAVAATLRERFGIALDPADIRPREIEEVEVPAGDPDIDLVHLIDESFEGPVATPAEPAPPVAPTAEPEPAAAEPEPAPKPEPAPAEPVVAQPEPKAAEEEPAPSEEAPAADAVSAGPDADELVADLSAGPGASPDEAPSVPAEPAEEVDAPAAAQPDERAAAPAAASEAAAPAQPATAQPATATVVTMAPRGERAAIRNLDTSRDEREVRVTATLEHAGRASSGLAMTIPTSMGVLRAVAEATLDALRGLADGRLLAAVDRVSLGSPAEPIATVVVTMMSERGEESLIGVSAIRDDPERAVMRATLDALNRRVSTYLETA